MTFFAPSKTFNLPGLQASVVIIQNAELRQRFQTARQRMVPWVNRDGPYGYAGGLSRRSRMARSTVGVPGSQSRLSCYDFVRTELPGLSMAKPEGTYLAWIDCRGANLEDPYEFFLNQARVALSDGAIYGTGGQGFVRLNFGCPRSTLEEALQRMKKALL